MRNAEAPASDLRMALWNQDGERKGRYTKVIILLPKRREQGTRIDEDESTNFDRLAAAVTGFWRPGAQSVHAAAITPDRTRGRPVTLNFLVPEWGQHAGGVRGGAWRRLELYPDM